MFRFNLLEIQHGPSCEYCEKHKPPYPIDPPDPTWMTRGGVEPEEDWEDRFVDYEGGLRVEEGEELDVDKLMEGF